MRNKFNWIRFVSYILQLFAIERNDSRCCGLFNVASLWSKSGRTKPWFGPGTHLNCRLYDYPRPISVHSQCESFSPVSDVQISFRTCCKSNKSSYAHQLIHTSNWLAYCTDAMWNTTIIENPKNARYQYNWFAITTLRWHGHFQWPSRSNEFVMDEGAGILNRGVFLKF